VKLLREGWASEEKKRSYYDYIHDESERLSRLIGNVLQLARLERGSLALECQPQTADALVRLAYSKIERQLEPAGFRVQAAAAAGCAQREVMVDSDTFVQIMINLADNAAKFAAAAERRDIVLGVALHGTRALRFSLRDYGPGVDVSQRQRIFELFYRPDDDATRAAPGAGIGLALVRQLARAMGGEIDVVNRDPGAEFGLILPCRLHAGATSR